MREELAAIGARLRAARHARGWTLDELAGRAGMSVSTLSRLESGKRQASLELLLPLTRQLAIGIDDLIVAETRDPRVRRPVIHRDGLIIAPLAPEHSPVHTFKVTYPPIRQLPELRVHDGYEWLYVLSGRCGCDWANRTSSYRVARLPSSIPACRMRCLLRVAGRRR